MRQSSLRASVLALALATFTGLADTVPLEARTVRGQEHCVVNIPTDDGLNMREWPSASAPIVTTKPYGSCRIYIYGECRGNWCPAEDGHFAGWMYRRYLDVVSPPSYCVANVARNDWLNLRAYPSANSRVLARLAPYTCGIAFLPYAVGNWQKIRVGGWEGWVNRRYVGGQ